MNLHQAYAIASSRPFSWGDYGIPEHGKKPRFVARGERDGNQPKCPCGKLAHYEYLYTVDGKRLHRSQFTCYECRRPR